MYVGSRLWVCSACSPQSRKTSCSLDLPTLKSMFLEAHLNNGLPLPEQDILKEYSNDYSNLHNSTQIQTNTSKQNMGFLSTKRTMKDNREQAVPYPAFDIFFS